VKSKCACPPLPSPLGIYGTLKISKAALELHRNAEEIDNESKSGLQKTSNSKNTAVFTDYRLICIGLALFMSILFIGTSESMWLLKLVVL
jgi:hypothetical protein